MEDFIRQILSADWHDEQSYLLNPIALTQIDRLALGIQDEQIETDKDIENLNVRGGPQGIRIRSKNNLQEIDFTIPIDEIHIGFNNAVEYWKVVHAYHTMENRDARRRFFEMEGKVLFLRTAGKIKIGYLVDLGKILKTKDHDSDVSFNIYLARECEHFAEYTDHVIFPQKGKESGRRNICLQDLGTEIYLQARLPLSRSGR